MYLGIAPVHDQQLRFRLGHRAIGSTGGDVHLTKLTVRKSKNLEILGHSLFIGNSKNKTIRYEIKKPSHGRIRKIRVKAES